MADKRDQERKGPAASTRAAKNRDHEESEPDNLFKYGGEGYVLVRHVTQAVAIRRHTDCRTEFIVTKVFNVNQRPLDYKPSEIRILNLLAPCNRIVQLLAFQDAVPNPFSKTAIYPYSEQGDLYQWRTIEYVRKSHKQVPESFIWRFVIQMSQALAFIHGQLSLPGSTPISSKSNPTCVIHKDIKPKNILVHYSPSSTYPSFKLHDFGCASTSSSSTSGRLDRYGTYEWQPPENPRINTPAADIWSLGTCLHYLCLGRAPIEDPRNCRQRMRAALGNRDPVDSLLYHETMRYYAARARRIVTPINLDAKQQEQILGAPFNWQDFPSYNHQYSDTLDACMHKLLTMNPAQRPTGKDIVLETEPLARNLLRQMGKESALVDLQLVINGQVWEAPE